MTSRTGPTAILIMVALATFACSKTQDTAPERRVFGDPPTIEHVDDAADHFFSQAQPIECDFTEIMKTYFCELGGITDTQFMQDIGWQAADPHDSGPISDSPGVFIEGTYDEIVLRAKVSDPNSPAPPAPSNILLVSASFPEPQTPDRETTLVLFDDGSVNKFKFPQKFTRNGEDCVIDAFGRCVCSQAKYDVTSGDQTSADGFFTRKLGMVDKGTVSGQASEFLQDCIMRVTHQTPILANQGDSYVFKVEAVDRQGNLTAWPILLNAVIGPSSFACSGDQCGCCFLQANDPSICSQLPGSTSSSFPDGLCKAF